MYPGLSPSSTSDISIQPTAKKYWMPKTLLNNGGHTKLHVFTHCFQIKKYLAVLATRSPSERLFSLPGNIVVH